MKKFDVICLGRVAVDLYAQQIGSPLENVQSFSKYLGGSSGNIAYGCARQGLNVSMLARVGKDHFGRFIKTQLEDVGVDTSHIIFDDKRLTALAILGIKDVDTFPLLFYRQNCADMAIAVSDFSEDYISNSKSLLITGTHFSTDSTNRVCRTAIEYARKNLVKVILDIDYRPVLWGLTSVDDGETRYIESRQVSSHLLSIFPLCDLIVGTEEEFQIGGGCSKLVDSLKMIRKVTQATLVLKRGHLGNSVFDGPIPIDIDDFHSTPVYRGVQVDVLNVLGAGDGFMSGFLRGWVNEENYEQCSRYANACGALVVSRHSCAPAIPTKVELDYYLQHAQKIPYPDQDKYLNHLHRVTTRKPSTDFWQNLNIIAFDHRIQFEEMLNRLCQADTSDKKKLKIITIKHLIGKSVQQIQEEQIKKNPDFQIGVLIDSRYGQGVLNEITGKGFWIARPVETPKTHPVIFEPCFDIGTEILSWPQEHVIKCLVRCHPDDSPHIWKAQEEKVRQLYNASIKAGNELLLEIIPTNEDSSVLPDLIQRIYQWEVKPDWWKLFPTTDEQWKKLSSHISHYDPYCRGVLLLGLNQEMEYLKKQFILAKKYRICKGFAIGRSIFQCATVDWLQGKIKEQEFICQVKNNYAYLIELWKELN